LPAQASPKQQQGGIAAEPSVCSSLQSAQGEQEQQANGSPPAPTPEQQTTRSMAGEGGSGGGGTGDGSTGDGGGVLTQPQQQSQLQAGAAAGTKSGSPDGSTGPPIDPEQLQRKLSHAAGAPGGSADPAPSSSAPSDLSMQHKTHDQQQQQQLSRAVAELQRLNKVLADKSAQLRVRSCGVHVCGCACMGEGLMS